MAMHGVVSILDSSTYSKVKAVWSTLQAECGLRAIWEVPFPHFSWHLAKSYDFENLQVKLRELALEVEPFEATANGLGIFTGELPVIYLPVVRSPRLTTVHQMLWDCTMADGFAFSRLYAPKDWVPHITLANHDVDGEGLACVLRTLGKRKLRWRIQVDNFAIILHEDGRPGQIHSKYPFQGQNRGK